MTGEELKAVRVRLNLTQEELSKKLGVAANTVARWERNERKISEVVVIALRSFRK